MWKWLFWRPNSENLTTQKFERGRSVGQKDHYVRSYMTQTTLIVPYELLYAYLLKWENGKMAKSWFPNSETSFWVWQIAVLKSSLFDAILQKSTWKGYM